MKISVRVSLQNAFLIVPFPSPVSLDTGVNYSEGFFIPSAFQQRHTVPCSTLFSASQEFSFVIDHPPLPTRKNSFALMILTSSATAFQYGFSQQP